MCKDKTAMEIRLDHCEAQVKMLQQFIEDHAMNEDGDIWMAGYMCGANEGSQKWRAKYMELATKQTPLFSIEK